MAKHRYDVCIAQEGSDKKTYWKKVGVVLQTEKGFSLKMEFFPIGWDGWASLFEPKPKEERQAASKRADDSGPPF